MTEIQNLLEISAKRGITFSVVTAESGGIDGETSLKVSGPPSAVKLLRSHIEANEAAIIKAVQAGEADATNPSPVASPPTQNGKGQGERREGTPPTPLAILSRLHQAGAHRPWQPTAVEIDLALWLTEAVINCQRDDSGNVVDAGVIIGPEGIPTNISQTITHLCRGPQSRGGHDSRAETPAAWLERIVKLKALLNGRSSRWRASMGWRSVEWPAELKRTLPTPPPPNPVARANHTLHAEP